MNPLDYKEEHESLYRQLVSNLDGPHRKLWIDFVESTADYAFNKGPLLAPGQLFPGFPELKRAIKDSNGEIGDSTRLLVLGFSFGYSFPFCGLAFKYMARIRDALADNRARFVCLFPPEDPAPFSEKEGYATILDAEGRWASSCGLRMTLPEKFLPLAHDIPWFLADGQESKEIEVTLPGTCILSAEGLVRWVDLPVDVSKRLPPHTILETIANLNAIGAD